MCRTFLFLVFGPPAGGHITNLINSNSYDFIIGTDRSSFPRNGSKLGNTGAAAIVMRKTENHVNVRVQKLQLV